MPFCPNPECPHRIRLGEPGEFVNGSTICSDCNTPLSETVPTLKPLRKPYDGVGRTCPECGLLNSDDVAKCTCGYDDNRSFHATAGPSEGKNHKIESQSRIEPRYKTFWRRFWAGNIDALVFLPLGFIHPWNYSQHLPIFLLVIWFILHETAWYFYSVLMHGRYGQTLGKMACKVRVVDKSESKSITYRQAFFRDSILIVIGLILSITLLPDVLQGRDPFQMSNAKQFLSIMLWSSISTLWFMAELLTMLMNKKRRAIHDYIAGSVVIKTEKKGLRPGHEIL